jgi:L-iditol 2-dehydrogenase
MKVARLHGAGDLRIADEPEPVPGPGEAVVRVTAVGICGSDLHWYQESAIGETALARPLVLGHEAAGVVETGARAGQRVAIDPNIPCGRCETCTRGLPHLCPDVRFLGHSATDGAMRERMAWPEERLVPIPDTIDDAAGALLEPLGVAVHAMRLAALRPGDTIGIFGAGPIGRLLIRLALVSGAARVVATDRLPHRVESARADGAEAVLVDAGREVDLLRELLGGRPLDTAIEIAGEADAVRTAALLVRPGTRVVVAGIPAGEDMDLPASILRRKGLDLRFSRRMNRVYPEAIALADRIRPAEVVSAVHPIAAAASAMAEASSRIGHKVIVRPTDEPPGESRRS